jgi:pyroglutamyl-peptidase
MPNARVLVTGFEPYGGRNLNPAQEIMNQLDGQTLFGCDIVGRSLPVRFSALRQQIASLLDDVQPDIVISLGLWPGASLIRIERVALNVADFAIADNAGQRLIDQPVSRYGETALLATLPIRAIEAALLDEGIPARVSNTAGTFLCNACLYGVLEGASKIEKPVKCGFLHLPYLPEQVADLLVRQRVEAKT